MGPPAGHPGIDQRRTARETGFFFSPINLQIVLKFASLATPVHIIPLGSSPVDQGFI